MNTRTFGPSVDYQLVKKYRRPNNDFVIISGSCSVESEVQVLDMAQVAYMAGATHLRGGVFRAGTYPKVDKHFGWVKEDMIRMFYLAAKKYDLKNIIEVLDYTEDSFDLIANNCDVFQIGARSQQNYSLLRRVGQYGKPVFLKRNTGCTVDEWLGSAEHLLIGGVKELYLIERGSSTFHNDVRWTPTVHVIPSVKSICEIPVIIDASHSTGRRDLVPAITYAGVAAGASGILVECHHDPDNSISDAEQAVTEATLKEIINKTHLIRKAIV